MMLTIDIRINGKRVAFASARNFSDLADISSYDITFAERGSEVTGIPDWHAHGQVENHERCQSVWALVHKIAGTAASVAHVSAKARAKMRDLVAAGGGL